MTAISLTDEGFLKSYLEAEQMIFILNYNIIKSACVSLSFLKTKLSPALIFSKYNLPQNKVAIEISCR